MLYATLDASKNPVKRFTKILLANQFQPVILAGIMSYNFEKRKRIKAMGMVLPAKHRVMHWHRTPAKELRSDSSSNSRVGWRVASGLAYYESCYQLLF